MLLQTRSGRFLSVRRSRLLPIMVILAIDQPACLSVMQAIKQSNESSHGFDTRPEKALLREARRSPTPT